MARNNKRSTKKALNKVEEEIATYKQMKADGLIDSDTLASLIKGVAEGDTPTDPGVEFVDGKLYVLDKNPDGSPRFVRSAMRYTGPIGNRVGELGISTGYISTTKNGGKQFFPKSWTRLSDIPKLAALAKQVEKDFETE